MSIDDLLNQPLAPVRDDGFSVHIVRRLRAGEQRMCWIMWSLLAVGFLPVLAVLPFVDMGLQLSPHAVKFLNSQIAPPVAVLFTLFVWKARFSRL